MCVCPMGPKNITMNATTNVDAVGPHERTHIA